MQRRASQLTISFDPNWKQQDAFDDPLAGSELTAAFPATSRNYLDLDETTEDILDCTGENLLIELLTAKFARLTVDCEFDPDVMAGITAFAKGVSAAPTGGTNEVQTETVTATGGTRTLTVQIGSNAQTTTALAYNANAATIQAALEALSNVEADSIVVSGTGPYVYTFSDELQKQDVNLITVNTHNLTGGSSSIVETTPGVGLTHAITRLVGYTLPMTTLYIGFRGSDKQPVIFKNVVVNSIRVRGVTRESVKATIEFLGSAELDYATGFTTPECYDIYPMRFGDCQMSIGGVDYIAANQAREFEYFFQNSVVPQFDGQGVYSTRHERADYRDCQFSFWVLGEPGDALYELAAARTVLEHFIRVGPAGRHVKYTAPSSITKLATQGIRFSGDPSESEISVIGRPKKVAGNNSTPVNATAVVKIQETLLDFAP